MAPILVFLITLAQLGIIGVAKYIGDGSVLAALLIHGSPVGLMMRMLTHESVLVEGNKLYIALFLFHLWKYFLFYRARIYDEAFVYLWIAMALEALYLAYSAYIII